MTTQRDRTEQVLAAAETVEKLIDGLPEPRRSLVQEMMRGPAGDEFRVAPASSRLAYHSCYPGGLLVHSLNVVRNLKKLVSTFNPNRWSPDVLVFVGLFHDLGKVGDGVEPMYLPHRSDWHVKQGNLYEINDKCCYMTTSDRGIYILQNNGIKLTTEEFLSIRLNDGAYAEENAPYKMREPALALLVHTADRLACQQEKEE